METYDPLSDQSRTDSCSVLLEAPSSTTMAMSKSYSTKEGNAHVFILMSRDPVLQRLCKGENLPKNRPKKKELLYDA